MPLIGMVTRLVAHKGLDLVKYVLDELLQSDVQMVVLGSGDWQYESFFREMQEKYPDRFCYCSGFVPELARKIYAACDIFLMPSKSEPCGLSQMVACRYGALPVVRETGGLKDSIHDCGDGSGNGFTFQTYNANDMLYAIHRALGAYANKADWPGLVERPRGAFLTPYKSPKILDFTGFSGISLLVNSRPKPANFSWFFAFLLAGY